MFRLLLLGLVLPLAPAVSAQGGHEAAPLVVSAGVAAIGPGTDMGPGYHASIRRHVLTFDPDAFPAPLVDLFRLGAEWSASVEAVAQVGFEHSDGRWLAGTGVVARWDGAPPGWPMHPYVLPISGGLYFGEFGTSARARVGVGYGLGLGVEVPLGRAVLSLETRSIRIVGDEGGSIPVSLGLRF